MSQPSQTSARASGRRRRFVQRFVASITIGLLAAGLISGTVAAADPATNGWRGPAYGGGASRPSSDKPQSKLWFTDGRWFAGMFDVTDREYHIFRLNATHDWVDTGTVVDRRDSSHGDYLWNEATQTLYVASVGPVQAVSGSAILVYRYAYNASSNQYSLASGFPVVVPNTALGAHTVTLVRDSSGHLWTVWPSGTQVLYSRSTDDGATWSVPAQVPAQAANPIRGGTYGQSDTATAVAFGNKVGIAWSDHDELPAASDNGFWFTAIAAGADPADAGAWSALELLPSAVGDSERADNHLNLKATSDGTIYGVGKTGKDTANCATNRQQPLAEAFERTPAGTWSAHLVATVGDCVSRPQIVISEQLDAAYVLMTSPNGGGAIYLKSAPLSGPDALEFRDGADTTAQPGVAFIKSATETRIDDASTTKQVLTSASGLAAIANNVPNSAGNGGKYYLHNEMALAASDTTDPVGTVTIAGGAAFTTASTVSVDVSATDAGSGVGLVRVANSGGTSGSGLLNGAGAQTFSYATPITWSLTAGDGAKTVFAQWRDGAGNWSTPVSDTIGVDTTAPTGTISINNGDDETNVLGVTLSLTGDDGSGSGVTSVLVSNTADFAGATSRPFAASIPWTLTDGEGEKTVYVKFVDALGNTSASAVSDTITFDKLDTTAPSAPGAPVHKLGGTVTTAIPVRLTWAAGADDDSGLLGYVVQRSVNGGAYTTIATPTSASLTTSLKSGTKYRFRVATRDNAGNTSAFVRGPSFTTANYSEANAKVRYGGAWKKTSSTKYLGGKARYATARGASATLTFTGKQVSWVGLTGPTSGTARVYINGTLVKSVNLNATKNATKQLVFTRTWSTSAKRTIRIVVRGTAGHPRVTVDSFFVLN